MQKHTIALHTLTLPDPSGATYNLQVKTYTLPETGQDPGTIVFLHDSLGCIALWRDFPEELAMAAGMNALVYDRRGYGASSPFDGTPRGKDYLEKESDVLLQLLEHYAITNPILFGHSDGGTIALLAAAKFPGKIKALVTEGAHVFVEDLTLDGIEQVAAQFGTTDLPARLARYHGDKTQAVFDAWAGTWLADSYRDWNIEHFLPRIICPAYVIQGEADEFGSILQVQSITSKVSAPSESYLIPNAGHSPHKQSAYFLIRKILLFFGQHHLI